MTSFVGVQACQEQLERLTREAGPALEAAKNAGDDAYLEARRQWARKFFDFKDATSAANPGEAEAIARIDAQAVAMAEKISFAPVSGIVDTIRSLSLEVEALGKSVKKESTANVESAKRGRLLPVKNAIDALTGAVNQIKVLKRNLKADDPDEQKIATEAQALIEKFETLKRSIDAL